MRSLLVVPLAILFLQTAPTGCSDSPDDGITDPILAAEYFGETPPGSTPVLFAPGVFTHEMHSPPVFSPDGSEVYWQPMNTPDIAMKFMQMLNGSWTSPANVPFCRLFPPEISGPRLRSRPYCSSRDYRLLHR